MNNSPEIPENFESGIMKKADPLPEICNTWRKEEDHDSSPFYKPLIPAISLPQGGNVPDDIVEQCFVNTMDGTARMKLPLPLSPGRGGFTPDLCLNYNHRNGNGIYGMGWQLSLTSIQRKTSRKLPGYQDDLDSDTFQLTGIGDLIPRLKSNGEEDAFFSDNTVYFIKRYLLRVEGQFSRVEYIKKQGGNEGWWRITTRDNITTWYGLNTEACIADPEHRDRIFEWLPQLSTDHKGNIHLYRYVKENLDQVIERNELQEKNRCNGAALFTNTYLKRVQYNNAIPWFVSRAQVYEPILPNAADFLMEAVWDYGDHSTEYKEMPDRQWPVRSDPFSTCRSGFEIRTYRKCKRILQFHHFSELNGRDLVRSLVFQYQNDKVQGITAADTCIAVLMRGYTYNDKQEAWYSKDLPEVTFSYEPQPWENKTGQPVVIRDSDPVRNMMKGWYPMINYSLTDNAPGWLYQYGASHKELPVRVAELNEIFAEDAEVYRLLTRDLHINWNSPFTRLLVIEGRANVLLTEDRVWVLQAGADMSFFTDEVKEPLLLFRDEQQSVFLADMSGDGLADLVRVKKDEICYWPNMGYGDFGAKIGMGHLPASVPLSPGNLNSLALADVSGNGLADIIYLEKDTCTILYNLGGNGWSPACKLQLPAGAIAYKELSIYDFKNNGGSCLVWHDKEDKAVLYLDLTQGRKPSRLRSYDNGLGKTITFKYKNTTEYYLEDKCNQIPNTVLLSAPVDCVSEVHTFDEANDSRIWNKYTYRRGYADQEEQAFRGFAYVETTTRNSIYLADKEQKDPCVVLTKNWYDPGSGAHRNLWMNAGRQEQYFFPGWEEVLDTSVETGLKNQEQNEAFRALSGLPVRQEVYKFMVGKQPVIPVSVTAEVHHVSCVQPWPASTAKCGAAHAAFLVSRQQKLMFRQKQDQAGTEVVQELLLGADEYGNITKEARLLYCAHKAGESSENEIPGTYAEIQALVSEHNYTHDILEENMHYRLRLPYETKSYALKGIRYSGRLRTASDLFDHYNGIAVPGTDQNRKQLLKHSLVRFKNNRADDIPLDTGLIQSLAIPHACYQKVLKAGVEKQCKVSCITDIMLSDDNCSLPGDKCKYWISSGTARYDQPLTNFFSPFGFADADRRVTSVAYWKNYYLLPSAITDYSGNIITVDAYNWRNLRPIAVDHYDKGLCRVVYDALGLPVALTEMGSRKVLVMKDMAALPDLYDFADMEAGTYFFDHPERYAPVLLGNSVWRCVYSLEKSPATIGMISGTGDHFNIAPKQHSKISIVNFDAKGRRLMTDKAGPVFSAGLAHCNSFFQ